MQQSEPVSSSLVDDIYAAALGEQDWSVPLQGIRQLANVRLAGLLSFEHASRQPAIDNTVGDDDAWTVACRHQYNSEFYLHDPAPRSSAIGPRDAGMSTRRCYRRANAVASFTKSSFAPRDWAAPPACSSTEGSMTAPS